MMEAKTHVRTSRLTTFGAARTTRTRQFRQAEPPQLGAWPELQAEARSPGRGLQLIDVEERTMSAALPSSGSSDHFSPSAAAASDLTVWAQDLLELLDDSLAHMQAMQASPRRVGGSVPPPVLLPSLPEESAQTGSSSSSGGGSEGVSGEEEDSFPALKITEVDDDDSDNDDDDNGDSLMTASTSAVSSVGTSSYRAEGSPVPCYVVDEQEDEPTPLPPSSVEMDGPKRGTCTEIVVESAMSSSSPRVAAVASSGRRGRTLYETLMNQSKVRPTSSSPRPRISAFSLGSAPNHYSDDSSDEDTDAVCVEQIQDLDQLEKMLNESKQYEMRRRIRAQIRSLRKTLPPPVSPPDESVTTPSSPPIRPTSMFSNGTKNALDFQMDFPLKAHLFSPYGLTIDEGYSSVTSPMSPMDCSDSSFEASSPPPSTKMGDSYINGVNLLDIEDELELHDLLDHTEDIDDRKRVRNRLREVMAIHREQREGMRNKREQERENLLRKKVADADEQKRRTLAMYDAMAKSAPAGGNKTLDVSILRTGVASTNPDQNVGKEKLDLIEEAIRDRQRNCDETKKKTLAAFDKAARTAPAGSARIVDFNNVTEDDIREKENTPKYTSTFEMKGGVPSAKVMAPRIAPRNVAPERDLMEEAIRKRQAESDERKRRTLAAYDNAARSRPAGAPVSVYIPQNFDIEPVVVSLVSRVKDGSKAAPPSSTFSSNTPRPVQQQAVRQQPVAKPQPQQPATQSQMNIKTQSSMRSVNNPYQNARPAAPPQPQPSNVSTTRTMVTTQKTVSPVQQVQQRQVTTTVTTQSTRTVQQQQQRQQQQRYVEESEEEEEEEEELEEDY